MGYYIVADVLDPEVQRLAQTFMKANTSVRSFDDVMTSFNRSRNRELDEYSKQIDIKGMLNRKEGEAVKQHLKTLKELQIAKSQELTSQRAAHKKATDLQAQIIQNARADLEKAKQDSSNVAKSIDERNKNIANARKSLLDQLLVQRKLNTDLRRAEQELGKIADEIEVNEGKISKTQAVLSRTFEGLGSVIERGVRFLFNPARLEQAGKDIFNTIKKEMATGISMSAHQMWDTYKLGMNPVEFTDAMAQYRGAALAAGGLQPTMKMLEKAQKEYGSTLGDQALISRMMLKQMDTLRKSGIHPLESDTKLLNNSMMALRNMTGMMPDQFQDMMAEMQEDASSQQALQATANESERRTILTNIATRIKENVAMGMTIEQAKAATKSLNKLAGQTALDRIKQAAKLRAFGGAMGIAGSDEAAKALIAGQRATKEQKDSLQKFLSQSSNALTQSAAGPMGGEIFAEQLSDKLGLTQLIGPGSEFNTVLTRDMAGSMRNADQKMGQVSQNTGEIINEIQNVVNALMLNPLLSAILGGVGVIAFLLGKNALMDKAKTKVFDSMDKFFQSKAAKGAEEAAIKTGGKGLGTAAAEAEKATVKSASSLEGVAQGASKLSKHLVKFGEIGAVLDGLYEGYTEYKEGRKGAGIGKGIGVAGGGIAGAEAGAAVGTMIFPGVGTVIGGLLGGGIGAFAGGKGGEAIGATFDESAAHKEAQETATATADGISQQVKQMDATNDYLKQLLSNSETQNDLTGRMLIAMTIANEKAAKAAGTLIGGTKFTSMYQQVS